MSCDLDPAAQGEGGARSRLDGGSIEDWLRGLAGKRRHRFDLERAVYLTVLHRLFVSGSDRAAEVWKENYIIPGTDELWLHQLYRTMGWLGKKIGAGILGSPRCTKDLIEEALFDRGRDLFSEVGLIFFDTTSIYFEGAGGETLGRHGHSKDHRPDLQQMVVGIALDVEGRPLCCEMWPGNTSDAKSLVPVIERMRAKVPGARSVRGRRPWLRERSNAASSRENGAAGLSGTYLRRGWGENVVPTIF